MESETHSAGAANHDAKAPRSATAVHRTLQLIQSDDPNSKVQAAKEIRRLTKTSHRCRRHFSSAVKPLVDMLHSDSDEATEASLLALLNLAVKDETNKIDIVNAGALEPIISFLQLESSTLQEYATASILTLSASSVNKPIIGDSGAIPLLVDILRCGSSQAKADAAMTLYNLSTRTNLLTLILDAKPIPPLVNLLKTCKKSSKTAEKVVEVLESGSLQSREHAVGTLLTMCQSDRCKYREPILKEGVIPGLLELTVQGTPKSRCKAQTLLRLLRDSPYPRSELQPDTLENIVCNIICHMEGEDQSGKKAKQMLADMVQVSMERSLRHLQQRALACNPADLPITSCASEVSLK
ncbi:hypothetical protein Vadar_002474 [Vaccinium darrowii]|uniref:Uncharacterized protein n=1 Tax=Vaccinium darrowii TaxID=229202 RepID=A0ACB7YAZ6_9ERIC|nr:hypothetical protein Vadar_002474 [Vaccinium darrowii]